MFDGNIGDKINFYSKMLIYRGLTLKRDLGF